MTVAIIAQARMTSTRLPGKVLMEVNGRSLIEIQLARLARAAHADRVIVATTTNAADDPIVALAERLGAGVHRGSEHDVLARYHGAAADAGATTIVRVTADCPLIDPAVVDRVIARFAEGDVDYASSSLVRTYPRGLDVEAFSFAALDEAHAEAVDPAEREHVTPFLYLRPERYRLANVPYEGPDASRHRWTVDTPEDFELIRRMLEALPEGFTLADALALIDAHPEWTAINAHVEQKEI